MSIKSLMLSKYSSDNETQGSKDSENIIPYNVLCINSFRQANSISLSGHHNRDSEKNINWFKKWKNRKKKGKPKGVKIYIPRFHFFYISGHVFISTLSSTDVLHALCSYSPFSKSSSDPPVASTSLSCFFVSLFDIKAQFKVRVKYILVAIQSQTFTY